MNRRARRRAAQRRVVVHYPDGQVSRVGWEQLAERTGLPRGELPAIVDGLVSKGFLAPRPGGGYSSHLTAGETVAMFRDRGQP